VGAIITWEAGGANTNGSRLQAGAIFLLTILREILGVGSASKIDSVEIKMAERPS
jgi:hypothetical protein